LTKVVSINFNSKVAFEYPFREKRDYNMAGSVYIIGFENNKEDGQGGRFNLILSN
jgi:hypothetical protein